jgi:hypothetical protein
MSIMPLYFFCFLSFLLIPFPSHFSFILSLYFLFIPIFSFLLNLFFLCAPALAQRSHSRSPLPCAPTAVYCSASCLLLCLVLPPPSAALPCALTQRLSRIRPSLGLLCSSFATARPPAAGPAPPCCLPQPLAPVAAGSLRRHDLHCGHDLPPLPRRREAGEGRGGRAPRGGGAHEEAAGVKMAGGT